MPLVLRAGKSCNKDFIVRYDEQCQKKVEVSGGTACWTFRKSFHPFAAAVTTPSRRKVLKEKQHPCLAKKSLFQPANIWRLVGKAH